MSYHFKEIFDLFIKFTPSDIQSHVYYSESLCAIKEKLLEGMVSYLIPGFSLRSAFSYDFLFDILDLFLYYQLLAIVNFRRQEEKTKFLSIKTQSSD